MMIKSICLAVLAVLVAGSWFLYDQSGKEILKLESQIEEKQYDSDFDQEVRDMKSKLKGMKGQRVFQGILLTFLSAGLVGTLVVSHVLPWFANKITHGMYGSDEKAEPDDSHRARVLLAQGEWEAAIGAFQLALAKDATNRMAWTEIARIQRQHLLNPPAALATLRQAIEDHDWPIDDVAFLMFRLAEIYEEDFQDLENSAAILMQIREVFPETRHSANAHCKLREWGMV
jgi:tetratricopeptide (TPR) repeat protein